MEDRKILEELFRNCKLYISNEKYLNEQTSRRLNEGLWEKIKQGLAKLGRYKAGGKIMGKGKIDAEAAEKIQQIIDKKGNEVIKELHKIIQQTDPKFPNGGQQEFLNTILKISAVYDNIVAATKKDPEDKNYLPVDIANGVIEDLAEYVKKYLDVDLAAVYTGLDEATRDEIEGRTTRKTGPLDPNPTPNPTTQPTQDKLRAGDVRATLQGKTPTGGIQRDSERMKTLKSNKLPLVLAGVGAALGALGWLAQTDWLKNLITDMFGADTPDVTTVTEKIVPGGMPPSEGFVHWCSQIEGTPMRTGADIQAFIDKYGADNVKHMFTGNGGGTVDEQIRQLQQLISGDGANKSVGELFRQDTFGDMKGGRNLFGVSKAASFVGRVVVTQVIKGAAGVGVGIAASVAGVGAVLVPLGIGLMGIGALVKLFRMKGQKQSRAKTLNDLYQSIQPVEGSSVNPPIINPDPPVPPDPKPEPDPEPKPVTITNIFINIRNYFTFINNISGGGGTGDDTGGGGTTPVEKAATNIANQSINSVVGSNVANVAGDNNTINQVINNITNNINNLQNSGRINANVANKLGNLAKQQAMKRLGGTVNESEFMDESELLDESKYITDRKLQARLRKDIGADKLKMFRTFLARTEKMKEIIKRAKPYGMKNIDALISRVQSLSFVTTDFTQQLNTATQDENSYEALKKLIVSVTNDLQSGKFKIDGLNESATIMSNFKRSLYQFVNALMKLFTQIKELRDSKKKMTNEEIVDIESLNEVYDKMKKLAKYKW